MTTTTKNSSNAPAYGAYVVRGDGESAFWHRVGSAWQHRDGNGLSINLAAMPVGGRIVLRAPREASDRDAR
tara:strand:+ start:1812 stop:2024 length:213 start_codon:yes stop_codon:yes gene_type:complete